MCIATEARRCAVTAVGVTAMLLYTVERSGVLGVIHNGENIVALGTAVYAVSRVANRLRLSRAREGRALSAYAAADDCRRGCGPG